MILTGFISKQIILYGYNTKTFRCVNYYTGKTVYCAKLFLIDRKFKIQGLVNLKSSLPKYVVLLLCEWFNISKFNN